ncbi:MAG: (deoxy)nucleoside triphosphate pyrophosphohydrolase [Pseudomonadota bacterium]
MVDLSRAVGKFSDIHSGFQCVVAAALHRDGVAWLMHRRPEGKHHAGLWEFPGGKVDPGETPLGAITRELAEELGITVGPEDCIPAGFAQGNAGDHNRPIVILLYKIGEWNGEPRALEGGAIAWYESGQVTDLEMPPLDVELAARLFSDQ